MFSLTENTLRTAKKDIEAAHTGVKVPTFVADVTEQKAVALAFSTVSKVDVLANNVGCLHNPALVTAPSLQDRLSAFEINVKGAVIVVHAFLKFCPATPLLSTSHQPHPTAPPLLASLSSLPRSWQSPKFLTACRLRSHHCMSCTSILARPRRIGVTKLSTEVSVLLLWTMVSGLVLHARSPADEIFC